ncbi:MAG: PHP domain-containing protein [Clostridiales bacterium]|nr:PHP domain-containing protein [Clostridiales bacterium]
MAADLHCHTKLSDGSVGIEDLIVIAQKSGIDTIAITDHDCLAGTVRGQVIGKRYGVTVIPGVEISAFDFEAGKKVHILSYLADAPNRLEAVCKRVSVARKRAGQIMMLKVASRFPITSDFIINHASGSTNLYKQHIMHALMDAGYTDKIFGDLYYALFDASNETNILAPTKYPSVEEVINEIHGAGGIAVLAHPALFDNLGEIEKYVSMGLDGVEVWHPSADEEIISRLTDICKKQKLLMTGGSDFHGIYGQKTVTLGACSTPQEHLDKLMGYKAKKKRAERKAEKEAMLKIAE